MIRNLARIFYITIIVILAITTIMAPDVVPLPSWVIPIIAAASVIISFLPYYISMNFFKKYEKNKTENIRFKIAGFILYFLCFPVKLWIIIGNLDLLINGSPHWAFG